MVTTGIGLAAVLVLRVTWLVSQWLRLRYAERAQISRQSHVVSLAGTVSPGTRIIHVLGDECLEIDANLGSGGDLS